MGARTDEWKVEKLVGKRAEKTADLMVELGE